MSKRKVRRKSPFRNNSPKNRQLFLSIPTPTAPLLWGNSGDELRPLYSDDEISGSPLDVICVLNSIVTFVDNECFFTTIRGHDRQFRPQLYIPSEDREYTLRIYVHNNNHFLNNNALNVRVTFELPEAASDTQTITGHIFSENTPYSEYWSQARLRANRPFRLEYIPGSALLKNNGVGKNDGCPLSDDLAHNQPVKIGYTGLNGQIPGGYQSACYVTIRVRAIFDP